MQFGNNMDDKYTKNTDHFTKQEMEEQVRKYTESIDDLKRKDNPAHGVNQELAKYYNERGHIRYLQVEFPAAVKDFTAALKLQPDMPVAYYNRGLVHYRLGRFERAIQDMKRTLELDENFHSAQQCLDQALLDKSKLVEHG